MNTRAFWTALAGAVLLAANAEAAIISYVIGATNQQANPQSFSFGFSIPAAGLFNFASNSLTVTVTDTGNDGASVTATLADARVNGVNIGYDLDFDCAVLVGNTNTCTADLSGPIAETFATGMSLDVDFTLSALDSVSISGAFEITLVDAPVPEPGTLALLGAGIAGLGLARRRRSA